MWLHEAVPGVQLPGMQPSGREDDCFRPQAPLAEVHSVSASAGSQGTGATGWRVRNAGLAVDGLLVTRKLWFWNCVSPGPLNLGNLLSLYGNEVSRPRAVAASTVCSGREKAMHDRSNQARRSCLHHQAGRRRALCSQAGWRWLAWATSLPLSRRWLAP